MKFKSHFYFKYRQVMKDQGITGQTQVGRAWINKCLAENRKGKQAFEIPLTQEEEMIIEEPTPALQGEPEETKLFPKVSYNDVDKCLIVMKTSYIAQVETKENIHLLFK